MVVSGDERYAERLSPCTKFAISSVKSTFQANSWSGHGAEEALYFGLIPRMHRVSSL